MNKKLDNFIHSRLFIVILVMVLIVTTTLVGTYAWFTWSNPANENTIFTMSIGKIAEITFGNGNAIEGELYPVFNYTDGLSTSFNINNKDISGTDIPYVIKLNITSIDSELISSDVKYAVVKNNELVEEGDFSTASNGGYIELYSESLSSGITYYNIYLYIDGNVENDLSMMGKSIVGNIVVVGDEENIEMEVTPYYDFQYYYVGQSSSTIDYIEYYDPYEDLYYDISVPEYTLDDNEILLVRYYGESSDVYIPDTYVIDGVTYNVSILSYIYLVDDDIGVDTEYGIFCLNDNIKNVYIGDNVSVISFLGADYYENNSNYLFGYCSSLQNVLNLPSSLTDMAYTFSGCTSLVNAPVIPDSVTNMDSTFSGCTNLTGTVKINSVNVEYARSIFDRTSKEIIVEVKVFSTTYNTLSKMNTNGMPSNVTLSVYGETPYYDFLYYYVGQFSSTIDYIEYDDPYTNFYYDISVPEYTLDDNEILLVRYYGESPNVYIPDTYVIDGVTYNVSILSYIYLIDDDIGVDDEYGIFEDNDNIENVYIGDNVSVVRQADFDYAENDALWLFHYCDNLKSVLNLPNSITKMQATFEGCTNLAGTVKINSVNVVYADWIFKGTSKEIIVEVPEGSATYTTLSGLGTSNGMPSNVTLSTFSDS